MDWLEELPTTPGRYWAWCKYDGDMMAVTVEDNDDYTTIKNEAGHAIICHGKPGSGFPAFNWGIVFTHFSPHTEQRPSPPGRPCGHSLF